MKHLAGPTVSTGRHLGWRRGELRALFGECQGVELCLCDGPDGNVDARGNRILDDTLLMVLNAHDGPVAFVLPARWPKIRWEPLLDTSGAWNPCQARLLHGGAAYETAVRSLAFFCYRRYHEQREV